MPNHVHFMLLLMHVFHVLLQPLKQKTSPERLEILVMHKRPRWLPLATRSLHFLEPKLVNLPTMHQIIFCSQREQKSTATVKIVSSKLNCSKNWLNKGFQCAKYKVLLPKCFGKRPHCRLVTHRRLQMNSSDVNQPRYTLSLGPHESASKTASWSVHLFLHRLPNTQTHMQTTLLHLSACNEA